MFLTDKEINSIRVSVEAAHEALILVEDAFCHTLDRVMVAATSDKAIEFYSQAWEAIKITAILAAGMAFYAGVLARYGWSWFMEWADGYVESCLVEEGPESEDSQPQTEEMSDDHVELAIAPLELLPSVNDAPLEDVTLPESIQDVQPKPVKKGGTRSPRTRKVKAEGAIS